MKVGYFLPANDAVYEVVRSYLPDGFDLVTLAARSEETEKVRGLDFLIAVRVTRAMIENSIGLRLLQLPGVGYDQVDLRAVAQAGIPVALSLNGSSDAVAEHALMLMLAVSRRVVELDHAVRSGAWPMWDFRTRSHGLLGRRLGLIGFGRIGREVGLRAAAFGMEVQYHDPVRADGWHFVELDELLQTSDIVSLHVPLTAATGRLLDQQRIERMKPGVILINTARGELIDEAALTRALETGHIAGAGLDVLAKEPPDPANPLLRMKQVILTPHVATGTLESLHAKAAFYASNIRRVLAGEEPEGLLGLAAEAS
jgi:phosphoglycerate dehydrogenase-like enzyme